MRVKLMANWRQNLSALIEIQKTREYSHKRVHSPRMQGDRQRWLLKTACGSVVAGACGYYGTFIISFLNPIELNFPGTGSSCICVAFSNLFLSL